VDLPVLHDLLELADLVGDRDDLYVRWSRGPAADRSGTSVDELTGLELPGLSASALGVEPWWGSRDRATWMARRIYDYEHLRVRRHGLIRPWVLQGRMCARGPDNEPLVEDVVPVAWLSEALVAEARRIVEALNSEWGPLDRPAS